jgi:hypothetical protein
MGAAAAALFDIVKNSGSPGRGVEPLLASR